jgi:triphosphatase
LLIESRLAWLGLSRFSVARKFTLCKETELKFEVSPRDLRKLRAARALRRTSLNKENLVSVYFDTPKHTLARNDATLRVRHNGGNRLQTIKSGGLTNTFRRGEWEHQIKGDVPNLRKTQHTALAPLLTKKLQHRLKPTAPACLTH